MKKLRIILCILLVMVLMSIICSCRSVQYVPVESVRTEIQYKDRLQRDSVHIRDSIFMYQRGDTIFKDRWHTEYKDKLVMDTAFIYKNDSIPVPYPVEKQLNKWQQLKMDIGGISIGGIIVLLFIVIWLIIKNRRK